jgi:hypothetical protein
VVEVVVVVVVVVEVVVSGGRVVVELAGGLGFVVGVGFGRVGGGGGFGRVVGVGFGFVTGFGRGGGGTTAWRWGCRFGRGCRPGACFWMRRTVAVELR